MPRPKFNVHLYQLRIAAGVSRVTLADAAGISPRTLGEIEEGRAAATKTLYDAAKAMFPALGGHPSPPHVPITPTIIDPKVTAYLDFIEPLMAVKRQLRGGGKNLKLTKTLCELVIRHDYNQSHLDFIFG